MDNAEDAEMTGSQARALLSRAVRAAEAGRQAVLRGTRRAAGGEWAYAALTSTPPPQAPLAEPWRLSVGTLLGRHPRTPQLARRALGLLDRFGAVHLAPDAVGFDGEETPWEKVAEIRTRNAFEVMTTEALEHEVDRIRELLPPVPGRKWLVTKAAEALATVVLAALERGSVDRRLDEVEVPVEIAYRGLMGRRRVQVGGLFAASVLVVVDDAARSLLATAERHGVPVRPGQALAVTKPDRAAHVELLRARTDAMADILGRLQQEPSEPGPGEIQPGEPQPGEARPGEAEAGRSGFSQSGSVAARRSEGGPPAAQTQPDQNGTAPGATALDHDGTAPGGGGPGPDGAARQHAPAPTPAAPPLPPSTRAAATGPEPQAAPALPHPRDPRVGWSS